MFEDANKVIESRRKGYTIQLSKEEQEGNNNLQNTTQKSKIEQLEPAKTWG